MIILETYPEAIDRLMLLDRTETAFSQDDSENDEEKIKKAQTVYQQKKIEKEFGRNKTPF